MNQTGNTGDGSRGKRLRVECSNGRCLISKHAGVVEEFGKSIAISRKCLYHISLVLDEVLSNIAMYGYLDQDAHHVSVTLDYVDGEVILTVADDALPFNILEAPLPDPTLPPEAREKPIGGVGILLVRKLMDNVTYERRDEKNILTLRKRIVCHLP